MEIVSENDRAQRKRHQASDTTRLYIAARQHRGKGFHKKIWAPSARYLHRSHAETFNSRMLRPNRE